jgi:hypothetical protein
MILGVAILVAIAWVAHVAFGMFRHVNSAALSNATVGLALNSPNGEDAYTDLSLSNVQPGADMYVGLTVANTGGSDFRYSMSSTASGDAKLARAVRIGIVVVASGGCGAAGYAAGVQVLRDAADLDRASIGVRALPASSSEYLCFHLRLPWGLPNSLQGQSAADTLNFTAQP